MERVQLLNKYLKEFPPFNNNQSLPEDAVVEDRIPRSTKNLERLLAHARLSMSRRAILTHLLDTSVNVIKTMEEWSED